MSTPEQKIAALEAEIDGYTGDLKAAPEARKDRLIDLIIETTRTLNRLLDAQAAAIAGNAPPVTSLRFMSPPVTSLRFMCPLTPVLKPTRSAIILYF
jgi:hypothetical protein